MEPLYLGIGRECITPPVGGNLCGYYPDVYSESVADDLTVTAFCFRQGGTVCMMLTATLCNIRTDINEHLRAALEAQLGIPMEHILLCSTHTHSGPNLSGPDNDRDTGWGGFDRVYFTTIFEPAVYAAAAEAYRTLRPVTMGRAEGCSYVGINRRELNLNNVVQLGQSPWGCFNPKMTVLSFRNEDGTTAANLIHYACHGTSAGINHEITRDWSGVMTDRLEAETGGVTAFFNGPEGDVGPRLSNGKTIGDLSHVHALGAIAAADALRIYGDIDTFVTPELRVMMRGCEVPLKPRMAKEEAEALLERYRDSTVNINALMRNRAEEVLKSYGQGMADEPSLTFAQTMVALDRTVFLGFPYELFSEIGLRISRAFPTADILSLANANQKMGYFVTEDAICRGGYEVNSYLYGSMQPYCEHADWELMRSAIANVNAILNNETEE